MADGFNSAFLFGAALPVPVDRFTHVNPIDLLPRRLGSSNTNRANKARQRSNSGVSHASHPPLEQARSAEGAVVGQDTPPHAQAQAQAKHQQATPSSSPTASPEVASISAFAGFFNTPGASLSKSSLALQSGIHESRYAHDPSSHPTPPRPQDGGKLQRTTSSMTTYAPRTASLSSNSGTTSLSARTTTSTDATHSDDNLISAKPFVLRNGRTYLSDTTLPYPLPTDLTELHRQSMRTLLMIQIFGAPVTSRKFEKKPPQRVLEVGCGSGFWSMMCHRYFKSRGHNIISFTGIDIAPVAASTTNNGIEAVKPDAEMKWKFVSHDIRNGPWPLPSEEYDLIMAKDMSLAIPNSRSQETFDEYIRLLRPGGVLEIWESDHLIRMLRPHVPGTRQSGDEAEEYESANKLGAYVINANTPLAAPLNVFLVEYNQWLSRALEARDLSPVPCTLVGPALLQESEMLTSLKSKRLAVPLSELRWERDGSASKDGKERLSQGKHDKRTLTASQDALRRTALLTVVQQVQALEPVLREVSSKSQDEWDSWLGKMMGDLMSESGTSWGECLEVGAWCTTKRMTK